MTAHHLVFSLPAAVRLAALAAALPSLALAQSQSQVLWPEDGHFYAYPPYDETDTMRFTAEAGVLQDDNLFRLAESEDTQTLLGVDQRDDTIRRLGGGIHINAPVSRQKLILRVTGQDYHFDQFDYLDHFAYQGRAGWKWVVGNALDGELGVERGRSLASFGELQGTTRNLITRERALASAALKFTARWRMRVQGDWSDYQHSNPLLIAAENEIVRGTVGFDYISPAGGALGIQAVREHGDFPNRQSVGVELVDNAYDQDTAEAVILWPFAGKSSFEARVGYTRREHEDVTERDFNGVTGRLKLTTSPSAKTRLLLDVYRELQNVEELQASYVLTHGAMIGPAWAPTDKLLLQLSYVYERRDYEGDPGFALGLAAQREDTLHTKRVIIGYQPIHALQIYGSYELGDRDSNIETASYDYETAALNFTFNF